MTEVIPLPPLKAQPNSTAHQVIPGGFLCLTYGAKGIISNICAVRTKDGEAVGQQLYFMNDGEYITCKTANGLSGQSFSNGVARWGTVYDDDGPPDPGEAISKEEWLDGCLWRMAAGLTKKT